MSNSADESEPAPAGSLAHGDSSQVSITAHWSGPLPPPSALAAYENALPGSAERILAMAEAELKHAHAQEREQLRSETAVTDAEIASERRGVWLGFVLSVLVIGVSTYLIRLGFLGIGVGLISVGLISLVGLFIYGRNHPRS